MAESDFPKHTLERALAVVGVIESANAGRPTPPTDVAIGLGISPGSSDFRMLLSSSLRYGLTEGSYRQPRIALTSLGERIAYPHSEEDGQQAKYEASLTPHVFRKLYEHFQGRKIPEQSFLENAIVRELGVDREHAKKCASVFVENMILVGLVRRASTGQWLADAPAFSAKEALQPELVAGAIEVENVAARSLSVGPTGKSDRQGDPALEGSVATRRVFLSHGKNKAFIPQLKELLHFGNFEAVVTVENASVSKPVPDKVLDDMRSCCAAILHIEAEREVVDVETGKPSKVLNPNVLIEIGAAMALYGRNFILLVREGVALPTNLQGLYEVRYAGETLDGRATLELLKAFNEFKGRRN